MSLIRAGSPSLTAFPDDEVGEAIEEENGSDPELRKVLGPDVNPDEYESDGIDDDEVEGPEGASASESDDEMGEEVGDISAELEDLADLEETRRQEAHDEFVADDDHDVDGSPRVILLEYPQR